MPLTEQHKRIIRQWIERAEEDLTLAKHAFTLSSGIPYRLIAYHAQQCAEKYLKALLVYYDHDFPYTHDISKLISLCNENAPFDIDLTDTTELTTYGVTARYPSEIEEVTHEEAIRMIALAEKIVNAVKKKIKF